MNMVRNSIRASGLLAACLVGLAINASAALAADSPISAQAAPSKETREQMATLHEQMAACLRSDKAVSACHEEMMKACRDVLGGNDCPMMGMRDHMGKDHPMGMMAPK